MPSAASVTKSDNAARKRVEQRAIDERNKLPKAGGRFAYDRPLTERVLGKLIAIGSTRMYSSTQAFIPAKSGRTLYQLKAYFPHTTTKQLREALAELVAERRVLIADKLVWVAKARAPAPCYYVVRT